MKTRIMTLLAGAALAIPVAALAAEVPQRGMPEAKVRANFGAPASIRGPVGSPAITRWNYDGFSVYFENGITLHTVVDRPASAAPDVVSGSQATPPPIEEASPEPVSADTEQPSPDSNTPPRFDPVSGSFVGDDDSAPADTAPAADEPVPSPKPIEPQPEPESEPAPATSANEGASTPAAPAPPTGTAQQPPADGEFRFDPVTGRIIISGELTPEQAAAKKQQQMQESAQEAAAAGAQQLEETAAEAETAASNVKQQADATAQDVKDNAAAVSQETQDSLQAAEDSAEETVDSTQQDGDAEDGGFYIDWGARQ
ncbi:MAG: hypothetical protein VX793_07395 [Pseudomonadota bacterium]|nr:hypothetical protein [Pseudomonadota bacterium]